MVKKKRMIVALSRRQTEGLLEQLCQTKEYQGLDSQLAEKWKQRFEDYCLGKKTLPLTYDPFWKRTFHGDVHQERLSSLISSILGIRVKVVGILPEEDSLDGDVLLIMDMVVELEDGSFANVELQKIPYSFPAQRMSCYSSDTLLRQYSRVKGRKGKKFKYSDIKKVYTIIIFEKSTKEFHRTGVCYVHKGKTVFDTGLPLELLQEFYLINLDIFQKSPYAKEVNELNGWLTLLTTEDAEQVDGIIERYPWLADIYREMEEYLYKPEEVLGMYSEALKILDRNTTKYMIEELQKEVEQTRREARLQIKQAEDRAMQAEDRAMHEKEALLELLRESGIEEETIQKRLKEKRI